MDEQSGSAGPKPRRRLGEFEIVRELGRGGMGIVYEARQPLLGRRVALKVLGPSLGENAAAIERFRREARAAARLNHVGIVSVHCAGEADGIHYYAMDLIDGPSLARLIAQKRGGGVPLDGGTEPTTPEGEGAASRPAREVPTPPPASALEPDWFDFAARLIAGAADALEAAHRQGVIHRDIKPANLLLAAKDRLAIGDFGLATIAHDPSLTATGAILGTPSYMSPEQITGGAAGIDQRSDIYSLGAVLFEMLTLVPPFQGDTREAVLAAIVTREPVPPRSLCPSVPRALETICLKAMEKHPAHRYQHVREMAADLRRYLAGETILARRPGFLRAMARALRRHPVSAVIIPAAAVVLTISALAWNVSRQRSEEVGLRALAEAHLHMARGEYRDALREAERALEADAGLIPARLVRARLLVKLHRLSDAKRAAQSLLADDPDLWAAHLILASVARGGEVNQPRLRAPIDQHRRAVEQQAPGTADALYLRALGSESAFDAVKLLDRALEIDPSHVEALQLRVFKLAALKDFGAAQADCDRLVFARPRSAQGHRLKAWLDYWSHEMDRAFAELEKAIHTDPADPANYLARGVMYLEGTGDHQKALESLDRAVELGPDNPLTLIGRTRALFAAGRYGEAAEQARAAVAADPDRPASHRLLLQSLLRLGETEQASEAASELLERSAAWHDPAARSDALSAAATAYRVMGEAELAREKANEAVSIDPQGWRPRLGRARLHRLAGNEEGRRADCAAAAESPVSDPSELLARARHLGTDCGSWDRALEDLDRAASLAPAWADPHCDRGIIDWYLGRDEAAVRDDSKCIERSDRWWNAYYNRGLSLQRLGRLSEALADFQTVCSLAPSNALGYAMVADTRVCRGETLAALESFDQAIELAPRDALLHLRRAEVLPLLPGRCNEVAAELDLARRLDPNSGRVLAALAWVEVTGLATSCPELFDSARSLEEARRAADLAPRDPGSRAALGFALYRNGFFREALELMEKGGERRAADANDLFLLSMVSQRLGRTKRARELYDRAVGQVRSHSPRDPRLLRLQEEAAVVLGK